MTSLPLARVKSPVWERVILKFGCFFKTSSKPALRSIAGADPTVPWSSTMFTSPFAASSLTGEYATSHFAARRPSSTKSEPMKATQSESSFTSTLRSERMTGIFAAFASRRTGSQPVSTTGEKAMTSTF